MRNIAFGLVMNSEPNKWRPLRSHRLIEGDL